MVLITTTEGLTMAMWEPATQAEHEQTNSAQKRPAAANTLQVGASITKISTIDLKGDLVAADLLIWVHSHGESTHNPSQN